MLLSDAIVRCYWSVILVLASGLVLRSGLVSGPGIWSGPVLMIPCYGYDPALRSMQRPMLQPMIPSRMILVLVLVLVLVLCSAPALGSDRLSTYVIRYDTDNIYVSNEAILLIIIS